MFIDHYNGYYYLVHQWLGLGVKQYLGKENTIYSHHISQLCNTLYQKITTSNSYKTYYDMLAGPYSIKLGNIVAYNLQYGAQETNVETIEQFIHDFVYHSNKSEGSKIAYEDFIKIVHNKKPLTKNRNEIQEVQNSQQARSYLMDGFVWNEASIKRLHKILTNQLLNEQGQSYQTGYKKENNIVGNVQTVDYTLVADEMKRLLVWYKKYKKSYFPLQFAFEFHYKFEKIHPFVDGNGRVGRLLMNKILYDHKFIPVTVFSENRQAYFNAFAKSGDKGSRALHEFLIDQYKKTLKL